MTNITKIRRLFLEPNTTYSAADAAVLLGVARPELRAWIESGELEPVDDEGLVLPWSEVASFAMELWSQEAIEEELGSDVAAVIPELLRLTDLTSSTSADAGGDIGTARGARWRDGERRACAGVARSRVGAWRVAVGGGGGLRRSTRVADGVTRARLTVRRARVDRSHECHSGSDSRLRDRRARHSGSSEREGLSRSSDRRWDACDPEWDSSHPWVG